MNQRTRIILEQAMREIESHIVRTTRTIERTTDNNIRLVNRGAQYAYNTAYKIIQTALDNDQSLLAVIDKIVTHEQDAHREHAAMSEWTERDRHEESKIFGRATAYGDIWYEIVRAVENALD